MIPFPRHISSISNENQRKKKSSTDQRRDGTYFSHSVVTTGCPKKKSTINWTGEGKSTSSQGGTQKRSRTDSCKFFSSPALLLPG